MSQIQLSSADRNIQQLYTLVSLFKIYPGTRRSLPCSGGAVLLSSNQGTSVNTALLHRSWGCPLHVWKDMQKDTGRPAVTQACEVPCSCRKHSPQWCNTKCQGSTGCLQQPHPSGKSHHVRKVVHLCLRSMEKTALLLPRHASSLPVSLNFLTVYKQSQSLSLLLIAKWWLTLTWSTSKCIQLLESSQYSVCCTFEANLYLIKATYCYLFSPTSNIQNKEINSS